MVEVTGNGSEPEIRGTGREGKRREGKPRRFREICSVVREQSTSTEQETRCNPASAASRFNLLAHCAELTRLPSVWDRFTLRHIEAMGYLQRLRVACSIHVVKEHRRTYILHAIPENPEPREKFFKPLPESVPEAVLELPRISSSSAPGLSTHARRCVESRDPS